MFCRYLRSGSIDGEFADTNSFSSRNLSSGIPSVQKSLSNDLVFLSGTKTLSLNLV